MTTLLRLYPAAWRERYGDELLALLEEHPATLVDHFDLIRGALDARLHPQVPGEPAAPDKEPSMNRKILGLMAVAGGVLWMVSFVAWLSSVNPATGGFDIVVIPGLAISIALMGVAIGELGTRVADSGSAVVGHLIAIMSIVLAVAMPVPVVLDQMEAGWALMVMPIFIFPIVAASAAFRGRRNGHFPTWIAVAVAAGAITAWIGFGGSTPPDAKIVALVFGAAFVLLGAQTLLSPRPSPETAPA